MSDGIRFGMPLAARTTAIPGLTVWDLPVHGDARGWFKENWQREKMATLGLPDFGPVQNNVSFNDEAGTTRGVHAEPWDKWVSVATGRVFGAWVDLRAGDTFGAVVTAVLDPAQAVFVPRGVGNAFQTLEPGTAYSYLVNAHWSAAARYTSVNLADETLAIEWPVPLERATVSDKDRAHPRLGDVSPVSVKRMLVVGADGQVGRALRDALGDDAADYAGRADVDLLGGDLAAARDWGEYDVVINAAAFTSVDAAETGEGRRTAWAVNARAVSALVGLAHRHRFTLVHLSSDYVFDGSAARPYREDDPACPLGVYGQTKAAGDAAVATLPRHYLVRTSWVIGRGANFVRTMAALAARGVDPEVVADQVGRPTAADELARGIRHLIDTDAPFGTYNLTGSGEPSSWADVARRVFATTGHDPARVRDVSTEVYAARATAEVAPRPRSSVLDLAKIEATGFAPAPWESGIPRALADDE